MSIPDDAPTPAQILAYVEDRLDTAERQLFEARLARHPDAAAQAAAELQAWPDIRPAPGVQEPADENVLTSLRGLKARIREHHLTRGVRPTTDNS